jgi:hypothetical protein
VSFILKKVSDKSVTAEQVKAMAVLTVNEQANWNPKSIRQAIATIAIF